ncbi:MAG: hypothetical protein IJZ94_01795 [Clostridia bacterium]|nr:hypothetical protein [Clostridia bacterium]
MKKTYRVLLMMLTLVMLISFTSCSGEQSVADDTFEPQEATPVAEDTTVSEPSYGGVLRLAALAYDSLNPLTTNSEDIKQYMSLVYSSFVALDHSGKPEPEIAESWESSDGCMTWTFKLRQGISWHDGGTIDAEDVVSTINYIKTKGGIYADNVKYIKTFKAQDAMTVLISCNEPCSVLPLMMSFPVLKTENINTIGSMPVGSGMYSFNYIKSSQNKIYLDRFNGYYGDKPYIDSIEITTYATETEKYKAESDFSVVYDGVIKSENIKEAVCNSNIAGDLFTLMYFNLSGEGSYAAVKDANVRKAINSYLDRGGLINAAASGNASAAVLPVAKGNFLVYGDGASENSDSAAGDEFMKAAGYSKNESGFWAKNGAVIDIVCVVPADDTEFLLASERMEKDLEKSGISVTLNFCDTEEYSLALKNGTYSVLMAQISLSSRIDFESIFKTGAKLNINSFSDKEIDALIDSAKTAEDYESIIEIYGKISDMLKDSLPICGLYIKGQTIVMSSNLHGVTENGLYSWDIFADADKWYIE